jgi:DNA-binding NarL/FixJ family response regulator
LAGEADVEVCGQAEDVEDALREIETTGPDLVVVDISLKSGNGIQLITEMKTRFPTIKSLVWSMFDERLYAERALRVGAAGYINKRESIDHVVEAIHRVLDGEVYLSEAMTRRLIHRVSNGKDVSRDPILALSNRELEVFEMIGQGMPTRAIAENLSLSPKTIEAHRERIKAKLDLKDSAQLSRRAVQWCIQKE